MKQKIANYSFVLLIFIAVFGLFQAKKQNRNPFKNSNIESADQVKSEQMLTKNVHTLQSNDIFKNDLITFEKLEFGVSIKSTK